MTQRIELTGPSELRAVLSTHGARLTSLEVPTPGGPRDVVLGFDGDDEYRNHHRLYFGATVGRVANRIAGAEFELDGQRHRLAANDGHNHLHGGSTRSLDKVEWDLAASGPGFATFAYASPDLEEGYPGNLEVTVTYTIDGAALRIEFSAHTDRRTPVCLTHHSYWNLGEPGSTVDDHVLEVDADRYLPVGDDLIPTGPIEPVAGTPLDLRSPTMLGPRVGELAAGPGKGLDHNLVLTRADDGLRQAARLHHPGTGITMDLLTTEPGVQIYSGGGMSPVSGKGGVAYPTRGGICLEPQHFPDSVHHPEYPSIILEPGVEYHQTAVYGFGV